MGLDVVKELGLEEVTPDEAAEVIVIVMPCDMARQHTADSKVEQCSVCQTRVWVAGTSPAKARRVCVRCAPNEITRG